MRTRSLPALLVALLLVALTPAGATPPSLATAPPEVSAPIARDLRAGDLVPADRNVDLPLRAADAPSAERLADPAGQTECGYAQYPEDPDDASIKLGLTPYHEIAPKLCELEQSSDRVTVEVIGQSTLGRDLHLVTVTLPETPEEAARQDAYTDLLVDDPDAAIERVDELATDYKTPMFVNNNIHGNEWEGTDASLEVIEELALTSDDDQLDLLSGARLYFVPTMNPDGRVAGTRANAAGFDMNRDFITQSQPETRAVRDAIATTTPLIMLDIHGYTISTLIEPCTKPHNNNYEYDLYIKWALPQAEAMEQSVTEQTALNGAAVALASGVEIPYRDRNEGWDDWPPIFTPMYAMHQGAIGHTIEVPIAVNTLYNTTPAPVLQELSRQNTVVARAAIEGAFDFADANKAEMLRDQLEVFRRGASGEDSPGNDGEGNAAWRSQTFPEAYVISGGANGSQAAIARLVNMLLDNGIEVHDATGDLVADGTVYNSGSYLVDMRQPRRGLANVMLEAGTDISGDVASMYDISGWSLGLLWGAGVTPVEQFDATNLEPLTDRVQAGGLADFGDQMAAYWMDVDDLSAMRALDALWDAGIDLRRSADGRVWLAEDRETLGPIAADTGVWFVGGDAIPQDAQPMPRVRVAAAVTGQERFALAEMGADFTPVSTADLNGSFELSQYDVLLVTSGLSYSGLNEAGQQKVRDFLAAGGGVVGRGSTGAAFNEGAGLLDVARQSGPGGANGVVAVTNAADSPVTGSSAWSGQGHSFVYGPQWFTELGEGVRADQVLAEGNPLVAGHWRGSGATAPESAAGQALVVSGTADTARVVLFGSEPMFRAHPKGLYLQVAEALLWAGGR